MTEHPHPILEQDHPQVASAEEAERRLFEYYGLTVEERHVELSRPDIRVRVLEAGSGPPVLLVPGGVGDAWIFAPLMAELKRWHTIAVNRPGGGLSDGIDHREIDPRRLAVHTLTSVLDAFGLERIPVIGNSMGGAWSFWLALDRPERVSAVVQLGTPALILDTSAPLPMRLMSVPGLGRPLFNMTMVPKGLKQARNSWRFIGHSQEFCDRLPDVAVECLYRFPQLPTYETAWLSLMQRFLTLRGGRADIRLGAEEVERVQQPVLFIWGDNDPFGGLDAARRAARTAPNATLREVEGGHLPWWDEPRECGRSIHEFLSEHSRSREKERGGESD